MNEQARVVSFKENAFVDEFIAQGNLLRKCLAYKVIIHIKGKNRLNVFEELVLKVTAAGTENIADFTCLNPDLVFFVQSKLQSLGFLNDRMTITDEGKELLENWENENVSCATAVVYQDCISGNLLPFVNFTEPDYLEVLERKQDAITFLPDPTKPEKYIRGNIIHCKNASSRRPNPRDVIETLLKYWKRYNRYGLLTDLPPPPYSSGEVDIPLQQGEPVYLACKLLVPRQDPDQYRVSDSFGLGYASDDFVFFLKKHYTDLLTQVKEQAAFGGGDFRRNKDKRDESSLDRAAGLLAKWEHKEVDSSGKEKEKKWDMGEVIKSLYGALEHTLAKVVFSHPVDEWVKNYSFGLFDANKALLNGFARDVGFFVDEKNTTMLAALPGKIRSIKDGVIEMQPLLALVITGARFDPSHPGNTLAAEMPDFLTFLCALKRLRDPIRHGSQTVEKALAEAKSYYRQTEKAVRILCPEWPVPSAAMSGNAGDSDEDFNELRLTARVNLEQAFSISCLDDMDADMRELLLKTEMSAIKHFLGAAQDVVNDLMAILQRLFVSYQRQGNPQEQGVIRGIDLKKRACEKAARTSLLPAGTPLPPALSTVNDLRLQGALQGRSVSLQANCLAFILTGDEMLLRNIASRSPGLLVLVDTLATLGGHGNQILQMEQKKLTELKNSVFSTVKKLLEVFNG